VIRWRRNAQLSDAFLVINQIESYNAQDTEAVARLASSIERFTGVCVLVLEANIGEFLMRAMQSPVPHAASATLSLNLRITLLALTLLSLQKASTACTRCCVASCDSTSTWSP
jgi:hypothetical protein